MIPDPIVEESALPLWEKGTSKLTPRSKETDHVPVMSIWAATGVASRRQHTVTTARIPTAIG